MKRSLNQLSKHSAVRYLFIGGCVYLFELLVITLSLRKFNLSPVHAVGVSFTLGTVLSFMLHKVVTFGDKRIHHSVVTSQILLTTLLVIFNLCFTLLTTKLLANSLSVVIIRTLTLAATTIWNYYIYKTRIFSKDYTHNYIADYLVYINKNIRLFSILSGSVFVCFWTLLRFFVKNSNFDLVGQQLLARQWLADMSSHGAIVGPTNYVLKVIFIYIPFQLLPGSPRLKLILMTLIVNIVTFVIIVILIEKIWRLFYPKIQNRFYVAVIWLATISGSVYWIQFSNSRNLEVASGLFLVLLVLQTLKDSSVKHYLLISSISALLFFADPLQLYMTAVPVVAYYLIVRLLPSRRGALISIIKLGAALSMGFVVSLLIRLLAQRFFGVEFIVVADQTHHSGLLATLLNGVLPAVLQATRLYSGGYELGRSIQAINLLLVASVLVYGSWCAWKNQIPRRLYLLIFLFLALNTLVYVISGQSAQDGTSRYLIMTAPFVVLLIGTIFNNQTRFGKPMFYLSIVVVLVNLFSLTYVTYTSRDTTFSKDNHLQSVIQYMKEHEFAYGFASMDTALPGGYFSSSRIDLLPLACLPSRTVDPVFLFFYKSHYQKTINTEVNLVPIILDGNSINNKPSTCSQEDISAQYGLWTDTDHLSDGSQVLLYNSKQLIPHIKIE